MLADDTPPEPTGPVEDDRLRLIFTCCHPALAPENRVALTLRLLGGLTVAEIAHAFLVPETTMAQRITRAKQKIKNANIPYRVPSAADLPTRIATVLVGALPHLQRGLPRLGSRVRAGPRGPLRRGDPADPAAARGGRRPSARSPRCDGLLALMLLLEARRPARVRDGVTGHPRRPGPHPLGRQPDRRGAHARPRLPGAEPARALPAAGRDQRRAHGRARRVDDRLVADRAALRPADGTRALADRGPQPGGRGRRARRARGGAGRGRRPRPRRRTTPGTRPAPTCCAGSAGPTLRGRRTTRRSRWPATPPSAPGWRGGATG